ncbi:MAG TPA: cysteine desulfurase family protein [Stackebrandtia sp.]|uniref:cysteine desulfurase family protein n=1 Tax=Stackebrandtia sp. TaxID=2023065 RepID=UPI002D4BF971|nr:cysteine desulfurase family protein [Stackebrandtia sp.]HZE41980.1 cysteine desulfurase family protein [Stackebrandtia sp.]
MTYLDHAATTPMFPEARRAYVEAASRLGNPSSLHASGRAARRRVEEARERIAECLGAAASEVVFTGSGTEADNLALKGLYWGQRDADAKRRRVLVAESEHHAVLDVVHWLQSHEGAEVTWMPVDEHGRVDPAAASAALDAAGDEYAVASLMWANNEVGTVQPVDAFAAACAAAGVPSHSDAVQAVGELPVDFGDTALTALSLTGHKLGGPIGVGALLLRRDAVCVPLLHGGGQEREVRSGTIDVPAVVAFAEAVSIATDTREAGAKRVSALRDDLIARVRRAVPDAVLNGDPSDRLPGNAHFSFPGCEGDALLMLLDAASVECATGSACSAGVAQPSHVLLAMGRDERLARSSLRFSLGHTSTAADVDALIEALPAAVERARSAGVA